MADIFSWCLQDFEEFPEHRTHFFYLLQAATSQCFAAFLSIAPAQFKLILDSIIWAFKHTMRNVADTGLASNRLVKICVLMWTNEIDQIIECKILKSVFWYFGLLQVCRSCTLCCRTCLQRRRRRRVFTRRTSVTSCSTSSLWSQTRRTLQVCHTAAD